MLKILAILPSYIPSSFINVIMPLEYLQDQKSIQFKHCHQREVLPMDVLESDAIVLCRNHDPFYHPVFQLAKEANIPIIYDLDDNLFEVPEEASSSRYHLHPLRQAELKELLIMSSLIRVHSPVLGEVVQSYNDNVRVVHAAVDWSLVPSELPSLKKPLSLVYTTSRRADYLFDNVFGDIRKILSAFDVQFHIMGTSIPQLQYNTKVIFHPFKEYDEYFRSFSRAGYAIGLAPMWLDTFHQCKSNVKFREFSAAGIVGIYQNTPPYSTSVSHGETGLLVTGKPGSWFDAVQQLIEDPGLLLSIREKARQYAYEHYHLDAVSQHWFHDISHVIQSAPPRNQISIAFERWPFTPRRDPLDRLIRVPRSIYRRLIPYETRLTIQRKWIMNLRHFSIRKA